MAIRAWWAVLGKEARLARTDGLRWSSCSLWPLWRSCVVIASWLPDVCYSSQFLSGCSVGRAHLSSTPSWVRMCRAKVFMLPSILLILLVQAFGEIMEVAEAVPVSLGACAFGQYNKETHSMRRDLQGHHIIGGHHSHGGHRQKRPLECTPACDIRCSKASKSKPCHKYCLLCCQKCNCVPPGTYGNKEVCPCYQNMRNAKGGPKCP